MIFSKAFSKISTPLIGFNLPINKTYLPRELTIFMT